MVKAYRRKSSAASLRARERADAKADYDYLAKNVGEVPTDLASLRIYADEAADRASDRGDMEAEEKWRAVAYAVEELENSAQTFVDDASEQLDVIAERTGWKKPSWM